MASKADVATEQARPALVVSLDDAQSKVLNQIEKGQRLLAIQITTEEQFDKVQAGYNIWHDFTKELLRRSFTCDKIADELSPLGVIVALRRPPFRERISELRSDIKRDLESLASIQGRLPLFPVVPTARQSDTQDAVSLIERIARRFHRISRQLRQRHGGRSTLSIADEYDVQDLFHALLCLFFDDVRAEECTPSYAGGAARVDFLLKAEQCGVEVKKTRQGLGAKEVGGELLEDIGRYSAHPDCKNLVCFVYDPDGHIANPDGLERDLSRRTNEVDVRVIVVPKG
jgi:hypothetical protein